MSEYNDGKWHGWNGGDCPVHPKTLVEIVVRKGGHRFNDAVEAERPLWKHNNMSGDIVAFRVVKRAPREFWINEYSNYCCAHTSKEKADKEATLVRLRCIHVREVLE